MSPSAIHELFGVPVTGGKAVRWDAVAKKQWCPYLQRKCLKVRKSRPEISIGACSVRYGRDSKNVLICPHRFLERKQIFTDCLHLLTLHQPGNELHLVPEITIPGGHVDYFLASVHSGKVKDFVAIELQTLDSTGTVWPSRQRLLKSKGVKVLARDANSKKGFGINWKMTAKTILVQLHHKIETFEHLGKHLILVIQDCFLDYISQAFDFSKVGAASVGNPLQIHSYRLHAAGAANRIELAARSSTDSEGIAACLGLQVNPKVELQAIVRELEKKISGKTLFAIGAPVPLAAEETAEE